MPFLVRKVHNPEYIPIPTGRLVTLVVDARFVVTGRVGWVRAATSSQLVKFWDSLSLRCPVRDTYGYRVFGRIEYLIRTLQKGRKPPGLETGRLSVGVDGKTGWKPLSGSLPTGRDRQLDIGPILFLGGSESARVLVPLTQCE